MPLRPCHRVLHRFDYYNARACHDNMTFLAVVECHWDGWSSPELSIRRLGLSRYSGIRTMGKLPLAAATRMLALRTKGSGMIGIIDSSVPANEDVCVGTRTCVGR